MIKYRIIVGNQTIEFATEEAAIQYKQDNSLTEGIESFEYELENQKVVPHEVTPRQFRQALILSNISMQSIEDLINSQPEPLKSLAMIEWEYSTAFLRSNQFVNQLAPAMGLTQDALDDLWILAETL